MLSTLCQCLTLVLLKVGLDLKTEWKTEWKNGIPSRYLYSSNQIMQPIWHKYDMGVLMYISLIGASQACKSLRVYFCWNALLWGYVRKTSIHIIAFHLESVIWLTASGPASGYFDLITSVVCTFNLSQNSVQTLVSSLEMTFLAQHCTFLSSDLSSSFLLSLYAVRRVLTMCMASFTLTL